MKDLLQIRGLSLDRFNAVLDRADEYYDIVTAGKKPFPKLKDRSVITLFYENSTRTRTSFESAAKYLGAEVVNISVGASSVQKGESLKDTALTLDAMYPDVIVMRHSQSGAPHRLAGWVRAHVINGGDGLHAHPTQALLDMFTARRRFGDNMNGISLRIGELDYLPLRDGEADFICINLVLHHLSRPSMSLGEIARVLHPGGLVLVTDFDQHSQESMRTMYGDRWLGFSLDELSAALVKTGLTIVDYRRQPVKKNLALHLILARKNAAGAASSAL